MSEQSDLDDLYRMLLMKDDLSDTIENMYKCISRLETGESSRCSEEQHERIVNMLYATVQEAYINTIIKIDKTTLGSMH